MLLLILIIAIICAFIFIPFLSFCLAHIGDIVLYSIKDTFNYFKYKKWRLYNEFGIYIYGGMYGSGKTLSMVEYCDMLNKKYDDLLFISNIDLKSVPYIKFEYFEQLMTEPQYENQHIIFVIDEIGSLMNSRNYKTNRIGETQFQYTLNQIRKQNKTLLIASQRFMMCDKVFRNCAVEWIECHKIWRFIRHTTYDPYELENTTNLELVKPIKQKYYTFATDKLFALYDTKQLVKDFKDNFNADSFNPILIDYSDNRLQGNIESIKASRKGKRRLKNKK